MKKQTGFTPIEILVVLAVIVITLAGGVVVWQRRALPIASPTPSSITSDVFPTGRDLPPSPSEPFVLEFPQREVQFTDMDEALLECISFMHIKQGVSDRNSIEFIINNEKDYQALLQYRSPADYCDDFRLPAIDFSQFTLLGKYADGGGCSIDFVRKIYRDDTNKEVIYSITVVEEGMCKMMGVSMNWALVPKISPDYTVRFEVQ